MERTLISKKDLAERWGVTVGHITDLEARGLLTRTEVGRSMFPMSQVHKIEGYEEEVPTLKEVRDLKKENADLKRENAQWRRIAQAYEEITGVRMN